MAYEYNEIEELTEKYDIEVYLKDNDDLELYFSEDFDINFNDSESYTGLTPEDDINDIFDIPEDYNEEDYYDYDEEKELSEKYEMI